jgi:hypothetical protein
MALSPSTIWLIVATTIGGTVVAPRSRFFYVETLGGHCGLPYKWPYISSIRHDDSGPVAHVDRACGSCSGLISARTTAAYHPVGTAWSTQAHPQTAWVLASKERESRQ